MEFTFTNNAEFVKQLKTNKPLQEAIKEDPAAAMEKVKINEGIPNTKVYQMVIASLVVTVLVIVVGLLVMVIFDKAEKNQNILTIFTAIASTSIGALAGVLMPVQRQTEN